MFPVMLLSTVCSVLFAFCGLMGVVAFFLEAERGMSLSAFLLGFTGATWPLLASCALFLLQFILKELIAMREAAEEVKIGRAPAPSPVSPAPEVPEGKQAAPHPDTKPAPVYFPVRETPQGPRIVRPAEGATAPAPPTPEEDNLTFFKTR